MGKVFFNILASFAEFEVVLLRMRTREGMAVARSKGKLRCKPPTLTARQQAHLVKEDKGGAHSIADLTEVFSVSQAAVYRVLERATHPCTTYRLTGQMPQRHVSAVLRLAPFFAQLVRSHFR